MSTKKNYLIGPNVDFWLIGGGSILFLALAHLFTHFRDIPKIDSYFLNIGIVTGFLTIFINDPHFTISYKLAYSQGLSLIKKHYFCLVCIPLLLISTFALAYMTFETLGKTMMVWMVQILYITVGWHYTKQSYGCTMVFASFEKYYLTWFQKQSIRYQLLSIWWIAMAHSNLGTTHFKYYSLPYDSFNLTTSVYNASLWIWGLLSLNVMYNVFWKSYLVSGRWPPLNVLAPWLSMNLWWHPWSRQNDFYLYVVPMFHSLQYLTFVAKVETGKTRERGLKGGWKPILTLSVLLTLTWLYFELIPSEMDFEYDTIEQMGIEFFVIAAMLFINIHHYFLDHVIWRFDNTNIKKYLLANQEEPTNPALVSTVTLPGKNIHALGA